MSVDDTSDIFFFSIAWYDGDKYKKHEACVNFGRYALVVSNVLFFVSYFSLFLLGSTEESANVSIY